MDEYVFQGSPQKMTSFRGPLRKSHPQRGGVDIKGNGPLRYFWFHSIYSLAAS